MKLHAGKLMCSCLESVFEGIPCRHELCIYVKASQSLNALNVHPRWHKAYFDSSVIFSSLEGSENKDNNSQSDQNNQDLENNPETNVISNQNPESTHATKVIFNVYFPEAKDFKPNKSFS